MKLFSSALVLILLLSGCSSESESRTGIVSDYLIDKPAHFPEMSIPEDNPMTLEKVELGEQLFFDPILSSDTSISCASCHFPQYAFSDTSALSTGVMNRLGKRNAPPLLNIGYATSFFRDGGAQTLEMQMITPIEDENEMNLDVDDAVTRLKASPYYDSLFQRVFNKPPDLFGLTRAIAAYERTLVGGKSIYDKFLATGDSSVFTAEEKHGFELFSSRQLNCTACHNGFNLTDNSYRNNGLYELYEDWGHANLSLDSNDRGKFRVPSLRNIELTAPYMFDGSLATLDAVIDHYMEGGKASPLKDAEIQTFTLSSIEKTALIAFLNTLTDTNLTHP